MRDRNLERNIRRLEAFLERWRELGQFLERGISGMEFAPEDEAAFLDLKSAVAQEHEVIMTVVATSNERDDRPLKLLNLVPTLDVFRDMPEGMPRKIMNDWHNAFINLQALLGRMKGKQAQLAAINSFRVGARRVFTNPVLVILIAVAAGYGIYKFTEEWVPKIRHLMEK
jgi:hypothetical protein